MTKNLDVKNDWFEAQVSGSPTTFGMPDIGHSKPQSWKTSLKFLKQLVQTLKP